jgi:hypothetical protein
MLLQPQIHLQYKVMAVQYAFGQIVTNGLVLALDAADRNSYISGSATWRDLSRTQNSGALVNGPTFNSTNGGNIVFNGTNQYASFGNIMPSTAYTKCIFFNISNLTAANNLISGGNAGTHYFYGAGGIYLKAGHFQGAELVSNTPIIANTWYHGAVTFSTTLGFSMYQNGINVAVDASGTSTFTGGNILLVGSYEPGSNLLNGAVASAQVYNRVLSASEIQQNYNAQKARFGL